MLAAPLKTLISALAAAAGLAVIALTPATALADVPAAQAANARGAAAALLAGPDGRDRTAHPDTDPARDASAGRTTAGENATEAYPFNASGEEEKPSAAVTAETDNAQPRIVKRARRKAKRRARRRVRRRY
jgi:hypothetical protein